MSYAIDFSRVEKGSDLWLFWQTTDFGANWENLAALLSPGFEGKVWYEKKPAEKKLIIHGTMTNDYDNDRSSSWLSSSLEVSYRLTAPRFDHAKWPNASTEDIEGMIVEPKNF